MEGRLKTLMDFQKYEGNAMLQQVIDSVHSRYAVKELSLDDMEWVSAAGIPEANSGKKSGKDDRDADRRS